MSPRIIIIAVCVLVGAAIFYFAYWKPKQDDKKTKEKLNDAILLSKAGVTSEQAEKLSEIIITPEIQALQDRIAKAKGFAVLVLQKQLDQLIAQATPINMSNVA